MQAVRDHAGVDVVRPSRPGSPRTGLLYVPTDAKR